MARVAIVGGGLTGLAAAWHLRDRHEVVLFDAAQPGGQIKTIGMDGVAFDVGAEAFIARQPHMLALVRALGFADDVVHPALSRVALRIGDKLRPLPQHTVMGAPTSLRALAASRVLGPTALLRAIIEPLLPRRPFGGDSSVAEVVGSRFGSAVTDLLAEPLLGGVYAGRADRLSAAATAKSIWDAAKTPQSLLAGLARQRQQTQADDRPVFATVQGGLGRVVEKLTANLGTAVRDHEPVRALAHQDDGSWQIATDQDTVNVDQVVLAVPAGVAAQLLRPLDTEVAAMLDLLRTVSVAVVALSYNRADACSAPNVSGVLVPRRDDRLVKAVTVSANKWAHLNRADRFMVRASVGRDELGQTPAWTELDDDALIHRVDAEVRDLLHLDRRAKVRCVVRWHDALTQYEVGHLERVSRIDEAVSRWPGLHLGSAAYTGLGLASRAADAERLSAAVDART